jgi:HD superfamily phosphohydrolase YqeK
MELSPSKKIDTFDSELALIFDKNIRSFTEVCISMAPDYIFYAAPASTSGKYHPIDELSGYGTIIHTKRVVTVGFELSRGLGCENNRDQIISACILHDLRKQGLEKSGHTVKWHPDLGAKLVEEVYKDLKLIKKSDFEIIKNCVGYHYGPWSIKPWSKPLDKYTPEEMCVYLADYIASKKSLTVKQGDRFDG